MNRAIGLAFVAGLLVWQPLRVSADKFDKETAPFAIAFEDEVSSYRDTSVFVMPLPR